MTKTEEFQQIRDAVDQMTRGQHDFKTSVVMAAESDVVALLVQAYDMGARHAGHPAVGD